MNRFIRYSVNIFTAAERLDKIIHAGQNQASQVISCQGFCGEKGNQTFFLPRHNILKRLAAAVVPFINMLF